MPSFSRFLKSPQNDLIAFLERLDGPPVIVAVAVVGQHENDTSADAVIPRLADLGAHVDAFGRAGGRLLMLDIKNSARAAELTLGALDQTLDGILYACRTREAFFRVLSELGLDSKDVLALAQAYPLLHSSQEPAREGVTGHAHRLLEAISTRGIYRWSGLVPDDKAKAFEAYSNMADDIAQAVKIDLGAIPDLGPVEDEEAACRLPYPVCFFEYELVAQGEVGRDVSCKALTLVKQHGDWLRAAFFRTHPPGNRYFFLCFGASWTMAQGRLVWTPDLFTKEPPSELGGEWIDQAALFLNPLIRGIADINRPGVRLARIEPPIKLRRSRAAKNRTPLFDYHIVVERPSSSQSSGGGDIGHASPRLHERKGHYRMLASGRRVWVRATVVGKANRGVVGKELPKS